MSNSKACVVIKYENHYANLQFPSPGRSYVTSLRALFKLERPATLLFAFGLTALISFISSHSSCFQIINSNNTKCATCQKPDGKVSYKLLHIV